MGTVDELLVEKFSSIFEDKFFPEIAPQNIVENDKCFCVFSLNSFQAARMDRRRRAHRGGQDLHLQACGGRCREGRAE